MRPRPTWLRRRTILERRVEHEPGRERLSLPRQSAGRVLGINEAAWLIGFGEHDIPVLVPAGCSSRWASPTANAPSILRPWNCKRLRNDPRWLAKAIRRHRECIRR